METTKKLDEKLTGDTGISDGSMDGIATEIRNAREAKAYSFADLHRLTGLSRTALHQYESGARKPGARELLVLCKALEVSPNRILLGTEEPFPGTVGVLAPLARLSKSDPKKALITGMLMMPVVASILSSIGDNTLMGLATLADESLRARDPEMFSKLSKLVADFTGIDDQSIEGKSEDEIAKMGHQLLKNAGFHIKATD